MKFLIALSLIATGCYSNADATQKAAPVTRRTDIETQRDVFFRCLETIPTGGSHTSIGNEDWAKVISECHKVSVNLAVVEETRKPTISGTPTTTVTTASTGDATVTPSTPDENKDD